MVNCSDLESGSEPDLCSSKKADESESLACLVNRSKNDNTAHTGDST